MGRVQAWPCLPDTGGWRNGCLLWVYMEHTPPEDQAGPAVVLPTPRKTRYCGRGQGSQKGQLSVKSSMRRRGSGEEVTQEALSKETRQSVIQQTLTDSQLHARYFSVLWTDKLSQHPVSSASPVCDIHEWAPNIRSGHQTSVEQRGHPRAEDKGSLGMREAQPWPRLRPRARGPP